MKPNRSFVCVLFLFAAVVSLGLPAWADIVRSQNLQLHAGWNAVFLQVAPPDSEPAVVFANTSVDVVASFYAPSSSAQYVADPGGDLFKKTGWGVWYAGKRPDAFLKTLHAINGQQAYLVHTKSDCIWQVTGAVVSPEIRWQPDSFNLVGFAVTAQGGPTFSQFFAGSKAHAHNRIYRLANGAWRRVIDPTTETIAAGEAFWIYCDGGSKYQGPLSVETTVRRGLMVGANADAVVLRNQADHPITAALEHVPSGSNAVPLSIVITAVGSNSTQLQLVSARQSEGAWTQTLPPLEAGAVMRIPLEARVQDFTAPFQTSLLKITTDMGTEVWLPVFGTRPDLKDN